MRRRQLALLPFACSFLAAVLPALSRAADPAPLAVIDSIKGPDGSWDYAIVDSVTKRLFVARADGVMAVDLASKAVTPVFVPAKRVHGIVTLPGDLAISTNGETSDATLFMPSDGMVMGKFPAGKKPDAVARDAKSGLVAVMNGEDGTVTLIDPTKMKVVGTIAVGGKLEFAAADGQGRIFVNVEDKGELVALDLPAAKVAARYKLQDCEEPTGLALDNTTHILLSSCQNGKAIASSAVDGHFLAALPIGKGPDAVIFDEKGKRFLIPCGSDGVLSVISESADGALATTATVPTAKGARTGAIDPASGKVYLPTADFKPGAAGERPSIVPGSFHILVLGQP